MLSQRIQEKQNSLSNRDHNVIWHPYTQHQMTALPIALKRGEGAYVYDENNKSYLDCISSWWVNLHGHAQPDIAKAIYEQALQLEHVIFSGFTHEPAVKLAEGVLSLLPDYFTKVFYSDNGSTAIEVALKMAYQYWRNKGESQRRRFIAFDGCYHGDTFGAMSLGKTGGFFSHFDDLLFPVDIFDYPSTWMDDQNGEQKEHAILNKIQEHLQQYGHETAALIIEPLVQGSAGMRMCTPRFLQNLDKLVKQHNVLMVYDEVMTGFGRTGEYFACLKGQTMPDIICMAKGLTGGFLPLAMTVCREEIYQAFLGDHFAKALAHGHSYTANPLGCAAGLASLALLTSLETRNKIQAIERVHQQGLTQLQAQAGIEKTRYCGTIAAFEIAVDCGYGSNLSIQLRDHFLSQGLLIRPLGNVVYLIPPYCIDTLALKNSYDVMGEIVNKI